MRSEPLHLDLLGGRFLIRVQTCPLSGEFLNGVMLRREPDFSLPVLVRNEGPDLPLSLNDQSNCWRLHASGAQSASDPLPQQRRYLIADDAINDSTGLLGIDAMHVDRRRVGEGCLDLGLRNRVERHTFGE